MHAYLVTNVQHLMFIKFLCTITFSVNVFLECDQNSKDQKPCVTFGEWVCNLWPTSARPLSWAQPGPRVRPSPPKGGSGPGCGAVRSGGKRDRPAGVPAPGHGWFAPGGSPPGRLGALGCAIAPLCSPQIRLEVPGTWPRLRGGRLPLLGQPSGNPSGLPEHGTNSPTGHIQDY